MEDSVTETVQDTKSEVLEKPVTQEQFNKLMDQLEIKNKQVSSLDSKVSEYQKMLKEKEESLKTIETSKLTQAEQMQLELDKMKMEFQNERSSRTKADNKAKALEIMQDKGIDKRYIDFIPLDDTEAMIERLNGLADITKDVMQAGAKQVVSKLGGDNVPTGGDIPQGKITVEQWKSLSDSEKDKAFREKRIVGM